MTTAPAPAPVVPAVTFVTVDPQGDKFTRTVRPLYSGPPEHAHHVLAPGRYDALGAIDAADYPSRRCDLIVAPGSSHAEFVPDGPERIALLTESLHYALWLAGIDLPAVGVPAPELDSTRRSSEPVAVLRAELRRQGTL